MNSKRTMKSIVYAKAFSVLASVLILASMTMETRAQEATSLTISVKNHRFDPAQLNAPANVTITLTVKNLDSTPMEFESHDLRVEKIIPGNSEGVFRLRPLKPGSYKFFDEFNEKEAKGVLVVR